MIDADGPPLKTPLRSLQRYLWTFIQVVVLPGALLGIALDWWSSHQLVERQEQQARHLAAAAAASMGSHLEGTRKLAPGSPLSVPVPARHFEIDDH